MKILPFETPQIPDFILGLLTGVMLTLGAFIWMLLSGGK